MSRLSIKAAARERVIREVAHLWQPDLTKPHRVNRQWRLAFKWVSPYTGTEPSLVTVELHPHDDGARLVLSHERLPAETVEAHRGRWGSMLERRTAVLAH